MLLAAGWEAAGAGEVLRLDECAEEAVPPGDVAEAEQKVLMETDASKVSQAAKVGRTPARPAPARPPPTTLPEQPSHVRGSAQENNDGATMMLALDAHRLSQSLRCSHGADQEFAWAYPSRLSRSFTQRSSGWPVFLRLRESAMSVGN